MTGFLSFLKRTSDSQSAVSLRDIEEAAERIQPLVPQTPLAFSSGISELVGHDIFIKWENKLKTGSFKERGAANFLSRLSDDERSRGVCAASAGNHALALSRFSSRFGVPCHIVMPENAPLIKVQSTRGTGAEVILRGKRFDDAYEFALQLAKDKGYLFVPPFEHPWIIAGQGTCGLEITEQLGDFDSIIVPVGGGGLISGIATAVKAKRPDCFVLGVQSEWAVSAEQAGDAALNSGTIADGIAVKHPGKLTAAIMKERVDRLVHVSEVDIARAIIHFLEVERVVVEGAGSVALSALLAGQLPAEYRRTVLVVSGSNIDMNLLSRLIERRMGECGRLLRLKVSIPDRPGTLHAISGLLAGTGANVMEVVHDRSFSAIPGNVDISFLLEVRDSAHSKALIESLHRQGIEVREVD
jgi:threonine dehydratase